MGFDVIALIFSRKVDQEMPGFLRNIHFNLGWKLASILFFIALILASTGQSTGILLATSFTQSSQIMPGEKVADFSRNWRARFSRINSVDAPMPKLKGV